MSIGWIIAIAIVSFGLGYYVATVRANRNYLRDYWAREVASLPPDQVYLLPEDSRE
ncbi:hypothetical protein [Microbispora rosea]|uniref:hypothetical protein n=1 Tax=Microbispora rosea TaxID=58117 RepID=UPI000AE25A47|nr:hypothetical protein [Microbispora rosea]